MAEFTIIKKDTPFSCVRRLRRPPEHQLRCFARFDSFFRWFSVEIVLAGTH
jgi:hypothetical protein